MGAAVRDARIVAGMSQVDLAAEAQIGRQWLVEFEAGDKGSAPFDMVMRVLRVLALEVTLDPTVPRRSASSPAPQRSASDVLALYLQQGQG